MEFHQYKAVVSQKAVIVNEEGKILLLQRHSTDMSRPNGWDFPGGSLEEFEDPVQGIHREVKEETGLIIENVVPFALSSFPLHDNCWTTLIVYKTTVNSKNITISDEHQEFRWFTKEEILSSDIPQRYKDIIIALGNS